MRLVRFALLALAIVALFTLGRGASRALAAPSKDDPATKLDAAERAYIDLEYDKANKLADAVVKSRGLSHEQLVRAYRLLARTDAILDRKDEARDAFVQLLTYAPDEKEDRNLPPKVTERQLEARGVLSGYSVRPGIDVSVAIRSGAAGIMRVTTRDPTHSVRRVNVGWRWGGSGSFTTAIVPVGDQVAVDVAAPPVGTARLDFYAQALDDRDDAVFEAGNNVVPRTAVIEPGAAPAPRSSGDADGSASESSRSRGREQPARSSSILASPIFWAIAGGVLLGGGVVFATTRSSSPTQAGLTPSVTCAGGRC